jgi:hypothetical protein
LAACVALQSLCSRAEHLGPPQPNRSAWSLGRSPRRAGSCPGTGTHRAGAGGWKGPADIRKRRQDDRDPRVRCCPLVSEWHGWRVDPARGACSAEEALLPSAPQTCSPSRALPPPDPQHPTRIWRAVHGHQGKSGGGRERESTYPVGDMTKRELIIPPASTQASSLVKLGLKIAESPREQWNRKLPAEIHIGLAPMMNRRNRLRRFIIGEKKTQNRRS